MGKKKLIDLSVYGFRYDENRALLTILYLYICAYASFTFGPEIFASPITPELAPILYFNQFLFHFSWKF